MSTTTSWMSGVAANPCEEPIQVRAVRKSPFVDFHAAERFRERVAPRASWPKCIESVRRMVLEGDLLPPGQALELLKGRPGCDYFVHDAFPTAVAVVKPDLNVVVTVLLLDQPAQVSTSHRQAA
jgi:hypothetical protein